MRELRVEQRSVPARRPICPPSPTAGGAPESVGLLDGGENAYPRMLSAIAGAQRTVHLEVYAFAAAGVGARFVEALADAAGRGVGVEVQIDGWGSARGGRAVAAALAQAGCRVRIYNRLSTVWLGRFGRNHRKLLLIDDEVAFLGGINIGDENVSDAVRPGWADLALEIRGPQCAALGRTIRHEPGRAVESSLRIFLCGLGGGWRLRRRYRAAFAAARRRIDVAHGYFLPDRRTVAALTRAARRGVQVRLLLAGRSDVPFALAATRSLYRRLRRPGVTIQEWCDSVLHAKVATIDGRLLLAGSCNLDPFSLANLETLVEVTNPETVAAGQSWIEDHFARSPPMPAVESTRLQRWLLDPFGHLVARVADAAARLMTRRRRRKASPPSPSPSSSLRSPGRRMARRVAVAVIGTTVLALGVSLIVLPGPASVVIPLGLTILATEFVWARKLLGPLRSHLRGVALKGRKILGRGKKPAAPRKRAEASLSMLRDRDRDPPGDTT